MKTCPKCGGINGSHLTRCFKDGTYIDPAAKQNPIINEFTPYKHLYLG